MPARERSIERGTRRGQRAVVELGVELRQARLAHGLSLKEVGRRAGMSVSQASRIERGHCPQVPFIHLAKLLAAVGLDLSARAFPSGRPIRDAAHASLLLRLRRTLPAAAEWRTEVPLPTPGDQRAWDAVIRLLGERIGVEAETRPTDLQALSRAVSLKRRDAGIDKVILLLADTRHNRELLRLYADVLLADYPARPRAVLAALRRGEAPRGSSIVLL